jgi:hypothetical protein
MPKTRFPKKKTAEQELKEFKKAVKEYTRKACFSKETAMEALQATGMYTKSGRLKKKFR